MRPSVVEKRKGEREYDPSLNNNNKKTKKKLKDDDAVVLLRELGKNTKPIVDKYDYTEGQITISPQKIERNTSIPSSLNSSGSILTRERTFPYTPPPDNSFRYINDMSSLYTPNVNYIVGPFPSTIPIQYSYTIPRIVSYPQLSPVQPIPEPSHQIVHPGQISIGPNSILYQTLSDSVLRKENSKRNKFFYKEVKEYLEDESNHKIGFVNDVFFIFDPKLHVGPTNRDGTFEKRVRLHFIEWVDIKHESPLWLCWGTLLDTNGLPIFRESNDFYRIPGNQSTLFKTNKSVQGWTVADEDQKMNIKSQADLIKLELNSKWKNGSITEARSIVQNLNLNLNYLVSDLSESIDTDSPASEFWKKCKFNSISIKLDDDNIKIVIQVLNISEYVEKLYDIFECLGVIDMNRTLTLASMELTIKRFGTIDVMFNNMISLLKTKCFNGNMDSEETKDYLEDQEIGSYIIRFSQGRQGTFCIGFRDDQLPVKQYNNIHHDHPHGLDVIDDGKFDSWESFLKRPKYKLLYPKIHPKLKKLNQLTNLF